MKTNAKAKGLMPVEVAVLSIAEISGLTPAATADIFAASTNNRRKAFINQGKLVFHLDQCKLPKGQSVYGLLQKRGVAEGSIHQARMTADLIGALRWPDDAPIPGWSVRNGRLERAS